MDVQEQRHLHGRATETIKRLKELDRRFDRVATALGGPIPENGAEIAKPIEEYISDKFDTMSRVLTQLESTAIRLENTVGSHNQLGQASKAQGVGNY